MIKLLQLLARRSQVYASLLDMIVSNLYSLGQGIHLPLVLIVDVTGGLLAIAHLFCRDSLLLTLGTLSALQSSILL